MMCAVLERIRKFRQSPPSWAVFCGILLFAFIIRWVYGELHPSFRRDEIYYLDIAEYFAEYGRYPDDYGQQPPLLIFVLRYLYASGLNPESAARWITRIAGVVFVMPWWWIGKRLFTDSWGGMLLMFLMAVAPYPVFLSNQVLREAFSLPIAAWVLLLLLQYWQKPERWRLLLPVGVLCAFGNCCRYEFGELLLIFSGSIVWSGIRRRISFALLAKEFVLLWGVWVVCFVVLLYAMKIDALSWIVRLAGMITGLVC